MREAALAVRLEQQPVERAARDAGGLRELIGCATARSGTHDGQLALAMRVGEGPQRGRLAGAGGADDTDDPVRTGRGVEDEPALLVRELPRLEERTQEGLPVRLGSVAPAARDSELDGLALEREQLAGREPSRPAGRVLAFDELDAREARELVGRHDDLVDGCSLPQRAGDRTDEL